MKQQTFITSRERLNPRWQEAFEKADYHTHDGFLMRDQGQLDQATVYWLDISQLQVAQRLALLQSVAGKVQKLVVMTDEQSDAEAFHAMQSGAVGYCHYLAAPEQLREITSVVAQGGLWIGAQLMQKLLAATATTHVQAQAQATPQIEKRLQQLTPRERTVAIEVGKGGSNKEIAERLEITERTVKAHISVIFNKLEVADRVKLALLINNLSNNPPLLSFSTIA